MRTLMERGGVIVRENLELAQQSGFCDLATRHLLAILFHFLSLCIFPAITFFAANFIMEA
jgi:hypothetical protein